MNSSIVKMWRIKFLVFLYAVIAAASPVSQEHEKVCKSEQCRLVGAFINMMMNKSVNPCDDFYNYACGGWGVHFPMPNDTDIWNIGKAIEMEAVYRIGEILEEPEDSDDFILLKYEKWWYKSCMNLEKIEEIGISPLEEILDYSGGWPITMNTSEWSNEDHEWQNVHQFYMNFKELSSLYFVHVLYDDRNTSKNVLKLTGPGDSLYEILLKNGEEASILPKYSEFMKAVVMTFIKSENKTVFIDQIEEDIQDIITFEKNLHMIKVSDKELEDLETTDMYMTIEDLQELYDKEGPENSTAKINWLHVVSEIFKNIENVTIDASEDIKVETSYIRKLLHLLDETTNRVIVNYVHWKFIASSLKYTNKEMRDLFWQVSAKEGEIIPERWEECIKDMKLRLGVRFEFIERHFSDDTSKMLNVIVSEMRGEMLDEIERSTWLDVDTKEETMLKLHNLKWDLGITNLLPKIKRLEHIYDGMLVTSNYFESVQNAREHFMKLYLERLRRWRNPNQYIRRDPLKLWASYERSQNILVMSAVQLLSPLINSSLPLSINYGYIAPTIGQLMSRTLEKEVDTKLYVPPWSTYMGDTYKSYEDKTECLIRQYYNYSVGPSTIDENMYDAIGLKVAYNALQDSFNNENIEKLPELEELSDQQLFFVSFAAKYCQTASPKYLSERDPAFCTPNEYKVIGPLSNFDQFAQAFKCPLNSPMNPESKCIM